MSGSAPKRRWRPHWRAARWIAARRWKRRSPQADLVFLSQTIGRILDTVRHIDRFLKPGALVTDAGSTKCEIVDVARQAISRGAVSRRASDGRQGDARGGGGGRGAVPREDLGADAGRRRGTGDGRRRASFCGWLERIGARTVVLDADEHDRIVARTSHVPQLASTALAAVLADTQHLEVSGSGLADMTRLARSSYDLWRDILATNSEHIDQALAVYIQELEHIRENLRTRQLQEEFERGARVSNQFTVQTGQLSRSVRFSPPRAIGERFK